MSKVQDVKYIGNSWYMDLTGFTVRALQVQYTKTKVPPKVIKDMVEKAVEHLSKIGYDKYGHVFVYRAETYKGEIEIAIDLVWKRQKKVCTNTYGAVVRSVKAYDGSIYCAHNKNLVTVRNGRHYLPPVLAIAWMDMHTRKVSPILSGGEPFDDTVRVVEGRNIIETTIPFVAIIDEDNIVSMEGGEINVCHSE